MACDLSGLRHTRRPRLRKGKRFGALTILYCVGNDPTGCVRYKVRCERETLKTVYRSRLADGTILSYGCGLGGSYSSRLRVAYLVFWMEPSRWLRMYRPYDRDARLS